MIATMRPRTVASNTLSMTGKVLRLPSASTNVTVALPSGTRPSIVVWRPSEVAAGQHVMRDREQPRRRGRAFGAVARSSVERRREHLGGQIGRDLRHPRAGDEVPGHRRLVAIVEPPERYWIGGGRRQQLGIRVAIE